MTFGQAERLATAIRADDVVASIAHNRANLGLITRRLDDAREHAERSVGLYEAIGSGHGLAVSLATLGQVYVQLGDLDKAEHTLNRALQVRSPIKYNETTGAVFDTLAQIHLMRGDYDRASEYLRQAGEAYGANGPQAARWYEWSVKVLEVKIATRRGAYEDAVAARRRAEPGGRHPADRRHSSRPGRVRGAVGGGTSGRSPPAPERHRGAVRSAIGARQLGRVPAGTRHRPRQPGRARAGVSRLRPERQRLRAAGRALPDRREPPGPGEAGDACRSGSRGTAQPGCGRSAVLVARRRGRRARRSAPCAPPSTAAGRQGPEPFTQDAEDAVVRRLVDASLMPELLAREFVGVALELPDAVGAVVLVREPAAATRAWWRRAAWTLRRQRPRHPWSRTAGRRSPTVCWRPRAWARRGWPTHGGRGVRDGPERPYEPPAHDDRGRRTAGLRPVRGARTPHAGCREPGGPRDRVAAARVHLRQRRDVAGGGSDPTAAGAHVDGDDHRRERHRQGSGRASDPRRFTAQRPRVPALQLHHHHARAGRQPAVRAQARQLHRRGDRSARHHPIGRRRHAVPRRDRRHPPWTCSPSCSAFSNRGRSFRSESRGRSPWTCACWPRPMPISSSASPRADSARICTIASASSASTSRPCAIGARRFRISARFSCATRRSVSTNRTCS